MALASSQCCSPLQVRLPPSPAEQPSSSNAEADTPWAVSSAAVQALRAVSSTFDDPKQTDLQMTTLFRRTKGGRRNGHCQRWHHRGERSGEGGEGQPS
jgi:hypothetical protein